MVVITRGKVQERFKGRHDNTVTRFYDGSYKNVKCIHYSPCPVCNRCENKYPEKYKYCRDCEIKGDYHTVKEKSLFTNKERKTPKSETKSKNKIEQLEYI